MLTPHPFPTELPFIHDHVERTFRLRRHTRCPDRAFHFQMVLPIDWQPIDVPADPPTSDRPCSVIALYRTLTEPAAEVEVSAALLSREVAAADWLAVVLHESSHEVLYWRELDVEGGRVADVLSRAGSSDGGVISRWLVIKNGSHLFVVQARAAETDYAGYASVFLMAVAGFEVMHPDSWPLAESLKTFTRRVPGDFLIMFPESWQLSEDANNTANVLVAQIRNVAQAGQITFAVVARAAESDPAQLAGRYFGQLRQRGVPVPSLTVSPASPIGGFEETWHAAGEATGTGGSAEVRCIVGRCPDAWYLVALLGPSRRTAPRIWAVNRRAFEIVLAYLTTQPATGCGATANVHGRWSAPW